MQVHTLSAVVPLIAVVHPLFVDQAAIVAVHPLYAVFVVQVTIVAVHPLYTAFVVQLIAIVHSLYTAFVVQAAIVVHPLVADHLLTIEYYLLPEIHAAVHAVVVVVLIVLVAVAGRGPSVPPSSHLVVALPSAGGHSSSADHFPLPGPP